MSHLEVTLHMTNGTTIVFAAAKLSTKTNGLGDWVGLNWTDADDPALPSLHKVNMDHISAVTHRRIEPLS